MRTFSARTIFCDDTGAFIPTKLTCPYLAFRLLTRENSDRLEHFSPSCCAVQRPPSSEDYSRVLIEDRSYFGEGPFFDLGFLRFPIKLNGKLNEFWCEIGPRRVPPVLGRDLAAGT